MLLTILVFLAILGLLVFVHELGHFGVARYFGVKAEEFGFGFPPRMFGFVRLKRLTLKKVYDKEEAKVDISTYETEDGTTVVEKDIIDKETEVDVLVPEQKWKFVRGGGEPKYNDEEKSMTPGTVYSLNWVPLGGFVKIKGENGDSNDPDSFTSQPLWRRAIILLAGVTLNVALAAFLFSVGYMVGLPQVLDELSPGARVEGKQIQIVEVLKDTPAKKAGVKAGDAILSINEKTFSSYEEIQSFNDEQTGNELSYSLKRGDETLTIKIIPEVIKETGKGGIGVALAETGLVSYPWYLAFWEGTKTTWYAGRAVIVAFGDLLGGLIKGRGVTTDIAGPVGIAVLTGQVARLGFVYLLQFAAMLSLNLAIINAAPFPALDGGRVLFLIIEKFKGRPVRREMEAIIHNVGFALLMILVLFVTFRDVSRYGGALKNVWDKIF